MGFWPRLPPVAVVCSKRVFLADFRLKKKLKKSEKKTCALVELCESVRMTTQTDSKNYNVQIALGPARLEGETLADYLMRTSTRNADAKVYWLKAESLFDCAVREVVAEYNGKILFARNSTWKLELTSVAAAEINARYAWNLVDDAEIAARCRIGSR